MVPPQNEMQSPKHEISFPAIFLPMLCYFTLFPSIPYTSSLILNSRFIATVLWYLYCTMQWLWLYENAILVAFIPCTQRSVLIKMVDVCFSASLSLADSCQQISVIVCSSDALTVIAQMKKSPTKWTWLPVKPLTALNCMAWLTISTRVYCGQLQALPLLVGINFRLQQLWSSVFSILNGLLLFPLLTASLTMEIRKIYKRFSEVTYFAVLSSSTRPQCTWHYCALCERTTSNVLFQS